MHDLVDAVVRGIPYGCVYGLLAVGLVLTYRATGVFHLALGAQAFVSAAVYYDLRARHGVPILVAFGVAVVLVGPLLGLALDAAFFRPLRGAPPVARLVTSLGLLIAIPELVKLWFGRGPAFAPPSLAPNADHIYRFAGNALDGNEVITIAATVAVVAVFTAIFRFSSLGLRMRAVVESPRMAELAGVNADRVGAVAWMLSGFLAGLAGVLLAPLFAQVNANNFTTLLVAAIAAAAFGGLSSIPLTFLGGLLLGVTQQVTAAALPLNSVLAQGLRPSLPFAALLLLLLLRPGLEQTHELRDPLAGVDPPVPGIAARHGSSIRPTHLVAAFAGVTVVIVACFVLDPFQLGLLTQAVVYGVLFLSITVITGLSGQISLCPATFAALGAFTTAQVVAHSGLPVLAAMLLGAALAATVGALIALPAVRLGGIHLALATFAFALMFEAILVPLDWVGGGTLPLHVPRPLMGPIDFANDRAFLVLCTLVLVVIAILVVLLRGGRTGRFLDAVRGNERAAVSVGINTTRTKITAFTISAAIAGLGGGLLAMQQHEANPVRFVPLLGLFWVVVVVTIGSRTIDGAIVAGLVLVLLPELLENLGAATGFEFVIFGFGAVVYARHPEGVLTALEHAALRFGSRLRTTHLGWGSGSVPVPTPQPEPGSGPGSVHVATVEPRVTAHTESPSRPASLLEVEGITKRFAGITALYDVSLQVEPGEIVGLIGPNGAGKTTLFDCLTGLLRPDAGRVTFDGRLITQLRPDDRARLGIARTFQRCELWPGLSVRDHLLVAEAGHRGSGGLVRDLTTRGRTSDAERDRADTMLARLGLHDDRDRSIEELTLGRTRLVELARALEMEPRLLLLDEPSSGLDRAEMLEVGAVIDRERRERTTGILLVEHDLEMVRRFTERLYVINAGQLIAAGPTKAVMADPIVRDAYLGVTDPGAEQ